MQCSESSGGPTATLGITQMRKDRTELLGMVLCRGNYLGAYESSLSSFLLGVLTILMVKVPVRLTCREKQQKIKAESELEDRSSTFRLST